MEKEITKINKENILSRKAGISYLQILILVIASFAFSYIVYSSTRKIDEVYEENKEEILRLEWGRKEAKKNLLVSFVKWWFSRSKIGVVSAAEEEQPPGYYEVFGGFGNVDLVSLTLQCCPKLKSGASCQDVANALCSQDCAVPCLPTKCELTSICKKGCCFDEEEGLCYNSVAKQDCENTNGEWSESQNCNIEECRLGCCVLGRNTQFITEQRCEKLSGFYGLQPDFRQGVDTELECLALSNSQAQGACVIEGAAVEKRGCKFSTKEECIRLTGSVTNFYENSLCTNPELETNCKSTQDTICVDGKDEVYFKDSCGNVANIYDSSKVNSGDYWSRVVKKEDSCSSGDDNINSKTCGNCNYFLGSICGKSGNSYKCQDLNCKNAPDVVDAFGKIISSKDRRNGESWCVYDSVIGNGKDVVGSRHYKYYCIDGQVKAEGCGDFRTGICVESEIDLQGGKGKFSNAACRPNRAMECLSYNANEENQDEKGNMDEEKLRKECEENSDCEIRNLNFGKGYKFSVCTAKYPLGLDLKNVDEGEVAKKICDQADFTCTKVMVKELSGWKCVAGCECDSKKFSQSMNDWCVSLGDCGGYVNIAGEVTSDGYSIKKAPKIDLNQYKKYAVPVSNQKAEPGNFSELLASAYGWGASIDGIYQKDVAKAQEEILMKIIGTGGIAEVLGGGPAYAIYLIPPFAAWGIIAMIYAGVGLIAAKMLGITDPAMAILIGGIGIGVVVGGIALIVADVGIGACLTVVGCIVGLVIIAIAIIIFAVMKILGIGETKITKVVFSCEPWQTPRGGADCKKCTQDKLKPCTKYKCSSLGQTCEFMNEGTGKEICENIPPKDVNPPIISPWYNLISPGYKYDKVTENSFEIIGTNGECLTEFTPVIFGINTNKASQCKMDVVHTQSYDEMENYFGESSLYKYNHSMAFNMPSVESLLANLSDVFNETELANLKSIAANKYGNLTFFVRCIDKAGNSNLQEYLIRTCVKPGPDLTPPYVTRTEPVDGSYLAFNQNSTNLKIYVNEPANCKFNKNETSYELMKNNFDCKINIEEAELYGWACNTMLGNLSKGDNKIYIRCLDQPWLPAENESQRNPMQESYVLNLKKSSSELKISSIQPNGTMKFGVEPATVILKVKTEGGAENGKASCDFSFTGYDNMIQFLNTFSTEHTQEFNQLLRGTYNVYVKCEDIAGNEATGKTRFTVKIDNIAPEIIRVYNQGALKIITDEDAECIYDFNSCRYIWSNGTEMTGYLREHTTDYEIGRTYYIKCKDLWDNKPDTCSIIVKGG